MRLLLQWKLGLLKPALAGLLVALFFLLTLAASSDRLHLQLHADSGHGHGPCAVCAIAKGQLDAAVVAVSAPFSSLFAAWTLPSVQAVAPAEIDLSVAPARGPPASASFLS